MPEVITLSSSPPQTPTHNAEVHQFVQTDHSLGDDIFDTNYDEVFVPCVSSNSILKHDLQASRVRQRTSTPLSITSSPRSAGEAPVRHIPRLRDSARFDDSVFNDFLVEQPAKKRKLSPQVVRNVIAEAPVDVDTVFDLSSEPEVHDPPRTRRVSDVTNVPVHDLGDDADIMEPSGFSSSAPESRRLVHSGTNAFNRNVTMEILSDDDPIMSSSQPVHRPKSSAMLSEQVNKQRGKPDDNKRKQTTNVTNYTKSTKSTRPLMEDEDNILASSQPRLSMSPTKKAAAKPRKTSAEKDADKGKRAAEKEAAKEERRLEKERKAAEKQRAAGIAEVNKKKTDKNVSVEQMVVEMPSQLKGKSLGNRVAKAIEDLGAEFSFYVDEVDMTNDVVTPNLGNVVKWRRKIDSTYDESLEEWIPLGRTKTITERHILAHLTAEDFCSIGVVGPTGPSAEDVQPAEETIKDNLDLYITLLRSRYKDYTIILLIDGLASWLKSKVNAKNREYANAVRAQDPESSAPKVPGRTSRKRKSQPAVDLSFIDGEMTEVMMLHLQLYHQPLQIHHSITSKCWEQIVAFTQHLSTRPYRHADLERNLAHASFCMASGQFRTGQGDADATWIRMLEQVNRLTLSVAQGIVNAGYGSPTELVKGFGKVERSVAGGQSLGGETSAEREGREKAKMMLQDVKKALNRLGEGSDKRIGPQMSKRLYKVFMSRDEDAMDGIA